MSREILTFTPEFDLKEDIQYQTAIFNTRSGKEKRRALLTTGQRSLNATLKYNSESAITALWDFFRQRKGQYDTFLTKFPTEYYTTGEIIGTGDAIETAFDLDFFPIDVDTDNITIYFDDVAQASGWTPSNNYTTETSTITFDSAPDSAVVITADYEYYFQVRFADDKITRQLVAYQLLHAGLQFLEIRWGTYVTPCTTTTSTSTSTTSTTTSTTSTSTTSTSTTSTTTSTSTTSTSTTSTTTSTSTTSTSTTSTTSTSTTSTTTSTSTTSTSTTSTTSSSTTSTSTTSTSTTSTSTSTTSTSTTSTSTTTTV